MDENTEGITQPEDLRSEAALAGRACMSTSAGTFSLRRAHYFTETRKPLLSSEQQRALIQLMGKGDAGARRKLVDHHMYLVMDFAKRYHNRGLALLDLVRVGTQGLIHALEKFEPEGDLSFPAYASRCICRNIENAIANQNNSPVALQAATDPAASFVNFGNPRRT